MFRLIRITVLLYVLLIVAMTTWSTRARNADWNDPLWVVIYPVNGERSSKIDDYIRGLSAAQFHPIEAMMREQAAAWGVPIEQPIKMKLAAALDSLPPPPPASSNPLAVAYWSLRLRLWAWRNDTFDGPADIRLFAVYYDPDKRAMLAHSLGLQKGFLGVVNGYGDPEYAGTNNVVLAHEMLHTLGASDKYNPRTNQARFPDGFAEPERSPLYPQRRAELMAGRIPVSNSESRMPDKLSETMVGPSTALEIGWIR